MATLRNGGHFESGNGQKGRQAMDVQLVKEFKEKRIANNKQNRSKIINAYLDSKTKAKL